MTDVPACCSTSPLPSGADPATIGLGLLVVAGFTISVGHCLGMCGPLNAVVFGRPGGSMPARLARYHGGRLAGYAAIGAAWGLVGQVGLMSWGRQAQGALALGAAVLVLAFALARLGLHVPFLDRLMHGSSGGDRFRALFRRALRSGDVACGTMNAFLPCGPVLVAAAAAAATGSAAGGAVAMLAFGIGTVPALILFTVGAGRLRERLSAHLGAVSTAVVLIMGVQLGLRGLATFGVLGHLEIGSVVLW